MYNTDKAIITFKSIRGISLNSLVIFILAIIPAAIGIHSFFRYEDFLMGKLDPMHSVSNLGILSAGLEYNLLARLSGRR